MDEKQIVISEQTINDIDGGEVVDVGQTVTVRERMHHIVTASLLAKYIFWMLALTGSVHYFMIAFSAFKNKPEMIEELTIIFHSWLPVVSGFFGAAVTYYFTKDHN